MKNYEKYADEIKGYNGDSICTDFIEPYILKSINAKCINTSCPKCHLYRTIWLLEEYEEPKEPEIDWSKVKVDTAIYVKASKYGNWFKRHFAEYKNGKIYTWGNGLTSHDTSRMMEWKYAKLAKNEEPEVDWSKVEVDTPILVRYSEKGMWIRRKFAKFEDGVVYAWHGKETGHSKSYMTPWNYAKLAESERKDNISESNADNRR